MILSLKINDLSSYLIKQIKSSFPDNKNINESFVKKSISNALDKIELCFEKINLPYYKLDNKSFFNHLHGDHYSSFLYQLSREFYIQNNIELATKVFQLNKKLFGIDVFYTTILPEYYIFVHPIGTVIGSGADYSNHTVFYQNVTIGSDFDGNYPKFNEKIILFSKSSVIGKCEVGHNCILGANSFVINKDIIDNSIVTGSYPNNKIIKNDNKHISKYFKI